MKSRTNTQNLGKYVLLTKKLLGVGSFARVYEGYIKSNKKRVAIKVIKKSRVSKQLLKKMLVEITVMKSLNHPYIVKLFDSFDGKKSRYLVMELVSGGDLSKMYKKIGRGNGLPLKEAKRLFRQLASALKYLRSRNFVHRDLKPQNILLTSKILSLADVKIADFGLARELRELDLTSTLVGSPSYMGPEVLKHQKYSANIDLWSLGVILYEMLTGSLPFPANNIILLLQKLSISHVKYPKYLPEQAKNLMKKMLVKNPKKRISFPSFFAHPYVTDELSHFLSEYIDNGKRGFFSNVIIKCEIDVGKSIVMGSLGISESDFFETHENLIKNREKEIFLKKKKTIEKLQPMSGMKKQSRDVDVDDDDEIVIVKEEEDLGTLDKLIKVSSSGEITYPKTIFNFNLTNISLLNTSEDDDYAIFKKKPFVKLIESIEKKCEKAWIIGEAAYCTEKFYNSFVEKTNALVLYKKSLGILQDCFITLREIWNSNNMIESDVIKKHVKLLLKWVRNRYIEFLDKADNVKNETKEFLESNLNISIAEKLLFFYALKLAKEAAMNDYLIFSKKQCDYCNSLYKRAKLILEYIKNDFGKKDLLDSDKLLLENYMSRIQKLLKYNNSKEK